MMQYDTREMNKGPEEWNILKHVQSTKLSTLLP